MDIDGVLHRGSERLPGAAEFLQFMQVRGLRYVLLTNNSTRTPAQVAKQLQDLGIAVAAESILTSGIAAALYLQRLSPGGANVFVIGEEGVRLPLIERRFTLVDDGSADYVVLGMDREINYQKLKHATHLIRSGVPFIATNADATYPIADGLAPGAGALIAALKATTGVSPRVVGKPESDVFNMALEVMLAAPDETAVVGDRLDTDILGGRRAGLRTILVLTGVTSHTDLVTSQVKPDWVFRNLLGLQMALS